MLPDDVTSRGLEGGLWPHFLREEDGLVKCNQRIRRKKAFEPNCNKQKCKTEDEHLVFLTNTDFFFSLGCSRPWGVK